MGGQGGGLIISHGMGGQGGPHNQSRYGGQGGPHNRSRYGGLMITTVWDGAHNQSPLLLQMISAVVGWLVGWLVQMISAVVGWSALLIEGRQV